MEDTKDTEDRLQFAVLECKTSCPKCGGSLFLNGPAKHVHCDHCQSDIDIPLDVWESILSGVAEDLDGFQEQEGCNSTIFTGGFQISLMYGKLRPYCLSCKTDFPDADLQDRPGEDRWELTCQKCGKNMPVKHPPAWLKKLLPPLMLLLNTEESEPSGQEQKPASQPIVFTCPKCGAALDVDGSKRTLNCEYCGSSIYLPDDLWLRFHPAKTVRRWFAGFSSSLLREMNKEEEEEEEEYEEEPEPEEPLDDAGVVNAKQEPRKKPGRGPFFLRVASLALVALEGVLFFGFAMGDRPRVGGWSPGYLIGAGLFVSIVFALLFRDIGGWLLVGEGIVLLLVRLPEASVPSWTYPWAGMGMIAAGALFLLGEGLRNWSPEPEKI